MNLLQKIMFEKYRLSNGLDVILHEDHSIPMVAVNIWYHVGSKNEKRGRTGFAHLFEHMMFEGSQHHNTEYFEALEKIGGSINGSTNRDRTNYYEDVPSNYLELALWLESDRMGFLLPAMTQEKLDNQRDVVKNERRQGLDNQPYGKAHEIMSSILYPDDHPYSWTVIGSMDDLSAASLEDVSEFFRAYYTPNNASLCIVGDFEPSAAKELVEKYFGPLPPGPAVERLSAWMPELDGIKRGVAEDNVNLPRIYYAWHTPAHYAPGDAELDLVADILSSGKTSRLYRSLVHEMQIAQDVSAYQASGELSSTFRLTVTAREGYTPQEIEEAIDAELGKLRTQGVTPEELIQAQTVQEAGFVRSLERLGGFGGKADRLNAYNTMLGDPGKFQWDMERYAKVTVADVQQYVDQYLDLDKRVILHIIPQGELEAATTQVDRSCEPAPTAEPSFTPPTIQRAKLTNGLDLLVIENHELPLVHTSLVLKSGWAADPTDRPGAASLTAELLDEGTESRTVLQIAEEVRRLGANMWTSSSFDGSFVTINVLKRYLDPALELISDIALNPTLPEEELERQRKLYLGDIQQEAKQPVTVARKAYSRILYGPDHPYGQPYTGSGTEKSIKAITRTDLVDFYRANYSPNNAAVVMVGDITLDETREKLEKALKSWEPGTAVLPEVPEPTPLTSTKVCIAHKPGAAQSVIFAGNLGVRRSDPDYLACVVMNNVLGGQFTSRLNLNLREDKGYTYGAGSFFMVTLGIGSFLCFAQVQTEITKESIVEILKEMRDITGNRPLTDTEIIDSKNNMIKGFPQRFQTYSGIANQLDGMIIYDLPEDEWYNYVDKVNAVDAAEPTTYKSDAIITPALINNLLLVGFVIDAPTTPHPMFCVGVVGERIKPIVVPVANAHPAALIDLHPELVEGLFAVSLSEVIDILEPPLHHQQLRIALVE